MVTLMGVENEREGKCDLKKKSQRQSKPALTGLFRGLPPWGGEKWEG